MNNIEDKSKAYCTGCGACVAVCPVKAIEYKINKNGFYQAFVNKEKCIHCGKCKRVCIKFETKICHDLEKGKLYASRSKEKEVVKKCTSGGIAYEIAKYGIRNGYKILGTIYDYNTNKAKAIITDKESDLELIRGSKYIQSNTKDAINELISECKKSPEVKFIVFGTPCQIAGISKAIQIENIKNEIIKIDLFCHGVPSYVIWNKYLEEVKKKYKLKELKYCDFRNKKYGWHQYCIRLVDENCKERYFYDDKSNFYKIFFDNMLLNKSCYNCQTRMNNSFADIRLGDYWGKRFYKNNEGISAVLVLTDKGRNIIKKLSESIEIIDEIESKDCLESQSVEIYKNALENNELLDDREIEKLTTKEIIRKYRKNFNVKGKAKVMIKNVLGVTPKLKYRLKKIYYKLKR